MPPKSYVDWQMLSGEPVVAEGLVGKEWGEMVDVRLLDSISVEKVY